MKKTRAEQLLDLGQSVWLDYIRRGQLRSGEFDALVRQGVVGVTSNPTIFQLSISQSQDYDSAIQSGASQGLEGVALFENLAIEDIQDACDRLRPTWERTSGRDGRVSIEVNPHLAHDTAGTIDEARRLHRQVSRDNVMVKVPATLEGLPAIATLIGEGICINITLIFSLARYQQVLDAWLSGLEALAARGASLDAMRSVASFFVSRVDSKVDHAIEESVAARPQGPERSELESLKGKAAVANARLAYARFLDTIRSPRYLALAERGAHPQRPLWASTSTKNPNYRDVIYVEELIGHNTVNTMPPQTLAAFNEHGVVQARITRDLDQAEAVFQRLPQLGIPLEALIAQLEPEGVAAFVKSFDSLIESLESKRRELVT
jgi:transaldolase